MRVLRVDIETFSGADLKKVGVYRYAEAPDFQVLLFGYAFDADPVRVVDLARGEALPDDLVEALDDAAVLKLAYNAAFEVTCLSRHFGRPLDVTQWRCTSVHALFLGLPGMLLLGAMGVLILTGGDKWLEARVNALLPDGWLALTVRF